MIHPHVEQLVRTDMELLSHIASFIDNFPALEILSIGETMRQFADAMNNQLDLRFEANNLVKFAKKFANEKWALFPSPIEGFVTKNVLVETLMEGAPITSFMQLKSELGDSIHQLKMKLSDLGVRLILKMIFFDNFIHGDLHPGDDLVTCSTCSYRALK
jgi:aarF domain-containing kinase